MEKFIFEPLKGVGKVNFGDSRDKVHELLGEPSIKHEVVDYYFDGSIRFDFNVDDNTLEFIEFDNDEQYELEIYGVNPFKVKAKELEELLTEKNTEGLVNKQRAPFVYGFNNISVAVYRDATEQDILTSIEEAKQDGTYEEDKEWLAEELEKYSYFKTIGFGRTDYFAGN